MKKKIKNANYFFLMFAALSPVDWSESTCLDNLLNNGCYLLFYAYILTWILVESRINGF